jgi:PAS domain S-box-containing protein
VTSTQHRRWRPEPRRSDAYAASVAFFEHSLDGVLFTAPDGRILDANAAACQLLGRTKEEICTGGRASVADPQDARWLAAIAERRRTWRFAGPLAFVHGDGSSIELNVSAAIFPDADGELRSVVVMRPPVSEGAVLADGNDPAFIDSSGVPNRPGFVHLAEQQCHNAHRGKLRLGLVYIRLEHARDQGLATPPTASDRHQFATMLDTDSEWGDVIGRVAENDFAMLVRNDSDGVTALINAIYARLDTAAVRLHVGVKSFVPDVRTRVVSMLVDAEARMAEHEASDRAHHAGSAHCFFVLDRPDESVDHIVVLADDLPALTERESAVLRLLASRRSYDEIAQALFVSVNTVKTHVSHVYAKLGANSRNEAVDKAGAIGLLSGRSAQAAAPALGASEESVDFGRIALVAEALTAAQDADEILDIIVMQGLAGLSANRALVAVLADDMLVAVASYGYTAESIGRFLPARLDSNLPLSVAVRDQTTVWISGPEDAIQRFPDLKEMWPTEPRSWINAPLVAKGRAYGGFAATFVTKREFSEADRTYLRSLTNLSALALHDIRTRERSR